MTTPRPVRYRCEISSRLALESGAVVTARLLELSEHGAFVEEVGPLGDVQLEERATLTLPMPGGAPFSAQVRFCRFGRSRVELKSRHAEHLSVTVRGLGLEFDLVDHDELERLRDFLDLIDSR